MIQPAAPTLSFPLTTSDRSLRLHLHSPSHAEVGSSSESPEPARPPWIRAHTHDRLEVGQHFSSGRAVEFGDVIANGVGVN